MSRRLSVWLLASLAIHTGLAGVVLTVPRAAMPTLLVIDLVHGPGDPDRVATPDRVDRVAGGRPAAPAASPPPRSGVARGEPRHIPAPPRPSPPPVLTAEPPPAVTPTPPPSPVPGPPSSVLETWPAPPAPPPEVAAPALPSQTAEAAPPRATAPPSDAPRGDGDPTLAAAPPGGEAGNPPGQRSAGAGTAPAGQGAASEGARVSGRNGAALAVAVPGEGGGGDAAEYAGYYALLRSRVFESLTYPLAARRRSLTGTVQLELDIQPTGVISRVEVVASSSHRVLDAAALDTVRGVGRVPFPADVRPRPLRVRLPVVFDLR